jgi:separase
MLWGCSSGLLRDMGEFDRIGTPYNYMLAGWLVILFTLLVCILNRFGGRSPTLIANLWDVTDRDIDKLTQAVFDKMRLTPEAHREKKSSESETDGISIVRALAEAREVCKLKYITGAAPVVYGIPFYL